MEQDKSYLMDMVVPIQPPTISQSKNNQFNPTLYSPYGDESISLYKTKETFDVEIVRSFVRNCMKRFRSSVTYTNYKSYLMQLGLDRCQVLGIDSSMATLEMHHNFLKLDDITLMITNHILNTVGMVNTFMVVKELKRVHTENKVPIVMTSKTIHQLHHANKDFVLPSKLCFGFWTELIREFYKGLTLDISYKIIHFIDESITYSNDSYKELPDHELLTVRNELKKWSEYNEYVPDYPTDQYLNMLDSSVSNTYYLDLYNQMYSIPYRE